MLLVDHAALLLQNKNYNWHTKTYPVIKQDMEQCCTPALSSYYAQTQLAQYKYVGNVHGYIAVFTCLALKVLDLSEAEKLLYGLKPAVLERVILQDPCSF